MYIKDAIYKPIPAKNFTLPVAEGAVVTINGFPAKSDGSDAFGIVPTKIDVIPPTGRVYVAISGTVDLKTCGVTFSDAVIKALGKDFNFVPASEAEQKSELPDTTLADAGKPVIVNETGTGYELGSGGGGGLPSYTSSDADKAMMVVVPESTVIPAQTIVFTNGYGTAVGVDFSGLEVDDEITFTGTALGQPLTLTGIVVQDGDNLMISLGDDYFKADGSAYISEIEALPSVSVDADAVTVTGDATASWNFPALVVKAKGTATKSGSTSYTITVGVDISAEKIAECFTPDKARPVFVLLPFFSATDPYYDYETANRMFLLENSTESYLYGNVSATKYCKYDGTNNTLVYYEQAST